MIGLDIGTFGVRAAEISMVKGLPTLVSFGQVVLPPGAVHAGEIVDFQAVTEAISELWALGGFSSKKVVLGVANQLVFVRQMELPVMPVEEIKTALQFEAGEHIPIPIEDAVIDYQIIGQNDDQEDPKLKILLVAAKKDMIEAYLEVVEKAGLGVQTIDFSPFGLIRSLLSPPVDVLGEDISTNAIIGVGAGTTTLVVERNGVPLFVRVLGIGADSITHSIANEMNINLDQAEDYKRRRRFIPGDLDQKSAMAKVESIVARDIESLVIGVRGSIEYYQSQLDAQPISNILLSGGGSQLIGLCEAFSSKLSIPVRLASAFTNVSIGDLDISEAELDRVDPLLAVPIGLSLALAPPEISLQRISLLPSAVSKERLERRNKALLGVGLGVFTLILLGIWGEQDLALQSANRQLATLNSQNANLEQSLSSYSGLESLNSQISAQQALIKSALGNDVAWSNVLQSVASQMPSNVWLTSFKGSTSSPGTVDIVANGTSQFSTAKWLSRLSQIPYLTNPWVSSSTASTTSSQVNFSSTANLSLNAVSNRASKYMSGKL